MITDTSLTGSNDRSLWDDFKGRGAGWESCQSQRYFKARRDMDYSKLVPSRELCEEMARLGICQDTKELFYAKTGEHYSLNEKVSEGEPFLTNERPPYDFPFKLYCIAPTISRMMEKLPEGIFVTRNGEWWLVYDPLEFGGDKLIGKDNQLSNALAKALISIKKGQSNGG